MRNVTASRLIKPKIGKEFYMVKIYVVDTNVLIQAPYAIESFEDNEVVLPMVVIEELDHLKKAEGEVGMNARRSIRCLERRAAPGREELCGCRAPGRSVFGEGG